VQFLTFTIGDHYLGCIFAGLSPPHADQRFSMLPPPHWTVVCVPQLNDYIHWAMSNLYGKINTFYHRKPNDLSPILLCSLACIVHHDWQSDECSADFPRA
jgi:hypothetical protein